MNVTSLQEACQHLNLDFEKVQQDLATINSTQLFPEHHKKALVATASMYIIAEAINDKWQPDWNNDDERKWLPWFDMEVDKNNPSGFRFYDSSCDFTITSSTGGSRLCFKTEALSKYAATTFIDLYRDMMVIPK